MSRSGLSMDGDSESAPGRVLVAVVSTCGMQLTAACLCMESLFYNWRVLSDRLLCLSRLKQSFWCLLLAS